jgi:hypothetical protein
VTETIMMAITPMPPTRSATLESATMTPKKAVVRFSMVSRIWSCVITSKVLGTPGLSFRSRLSAAMVRSFARDTEIRGHALAEMNRPLVSS